VAEAPREQVAVDMAAPDANAPTATALAAARAGHRIGDTAPRALPVTHKSDSKARKGTQVSKAQTAVPGAATAALNRASLQKILAAHGTAVPRQRESAEAASPQQVAAVDARGNRP
jgi:hypothetical protein